MILYFKRGKEGKPVAFLPSGKVVLPLKGKENLISPGFFYVGEIVKEFPRFCIFDPHRKTQKVLRFSCGHEMVEKEGEEIDDVRELDYECPVCRRKLAKSLFPILQQLPGFLYKTRRSIKKQIAEWIKGENPISYEKFKQRIEVEVKDFQEANELIEKYLRGVIQAELKEINQNRVLIEIKTEKQKYKVLIENGEFQEFNEGARIYSLISNYKEAILFQRLNFQWYPWRVYAWIEDKEREIEEEEVIEEKFICPKCGAELEPYYKSVSIWVPESDDGYRPGGWIEVPKLAVKCSCGYEELAGEEILEEEVIETKVSILKEKLCSEIQVIFDIEEKKVKQVFSNWYRIKVYRSVKDHRMILDYPYSCYPFFGKVLRKNVNNKIFELFNNFF